MRPGCSGGVHPQAQIGVEYTFASCLRRRRKQKLFRNDALPRFRADRSYLVCSRREIRGTLRRRPTRTIILGSDGAGNARSIFGENLFPNEVLPSLPSGLFFKEEEHALVRVRVSTTMLRPIVCAKSTFSGTLMRVRCKISQLTQYTAVTGAFEKNIGGTFRPIQAHFEPTLRQRFSTNDDER